MDAVSFSPARHSRSSSASSCSFIVIDREDLRQPSATATHDGWEHDKYKDNCDSDYSRPSYSGAYENEDRVTTTISDGYEKVSCGESEDDLLSCTDSDDLASDASPAPPPSLPTQRTRRAKKPPTFSAFPGVVCPESTRAIFSFLDHFTLHSSLTVSKGWFHFAAECLYRDPFHSRRVFSSGEDRDSISPFLQPAQERSLVRLLLRSICCPSEPGDEIVLVCEDADDEIGACHVVDQRGATIRTTVNYMRFLEIFDWAPWQRYMDYWQAIHTHFATMAAAAAAESSETAASIIAQHLASDKGPGTAGDPQALEHYATVYGFLGGMPSPFRFSYHTILDWLVENPKANTIVLHPDLNFPHHIASLLPRWTTLCFDQTLPSSYCARGQHEERSLADHPPHRSSNYYSLFSPKGLIQGLVEHEERGLVEHKGKRVGGIQHLQLPSGFYYNTDELATQVSTLVQVIQRPRSLDVSAYPDWVFMSYDIPDDNLKDLVRFISMGWQQAYLSQQGFLRRCPNLKEIEIIVRNANEIDFGPDTSQRSLEGPQKQQLQCNSAALDVLVPVLTPSTTQSLEVARLYAQARTELHLILMVIKGSFSHSLRELKIALLPLQHQSSLEATPSQFGSQFVLNSKSFVMPQLVSLYLQMNSSIFLQGSNPLEGCPHLQRLTLLCNEVGQALQEWIVPQSVRELVLDGYGIRDMFDMSCLGRLPRLESLSLLDRRGLESSSMLQWLLQQRLLWPTGTRMARLKNLKLSGMAAGSFEFRWLRSVPALEVLEVVGLDYNSILEADMDGLTIVEDSCQSNDSGAPRGTHGPIVCKLTIVNERCPSNSILGLSIPAMDKNLLRVLERFCPEVQRLTINFRACACSSSQQTAIRFFTTEPSLNDRHLEFECGTLMRLKKCLTKLTHFATELFTMRPAMLKKHGFIPREHFKIADKLRMQSLFQWEECIFRLGKIEYVHIDHD